jgi:DNA polymerase-1
MRVFFDIETNNITDWLELSDLKEIKCIALAVDDGPVKIVTRGTAIRLLIEATEIIGHNILTFDIPAITKFSEVPHSFRGKIFDTLVVARLLYAHQREIDFGLKEFPKELVGSQSLKAWGYRLGNSKAEAPDFDGKVTEQMLEYCKQDVEVTRSLYKYLTNSPGYQSALHGGAIRLEHEFALEVRRQQRNGFSFDYGRAEELHGRLLKETVEIEQRLQELFPPKVIERVSEKTGKRLKPKVEPFNPSSRLQIAQRLTEMYGWEPKEFTPDGKPRVDEAVLASLDYEVAKVLSRYLTIQKRIGQLADGNEAWMRLVRNGKIHGSVNTNGAITGRCTHSKPNMAQVPTDPEYRSLFVASPGMVMVGVDASGLELRCLAHYLGRYDGGEYAKQILEGDIHWTNAKAFGLVKDVEFDRNNPEHKAIRNQAKGAIYALIYGAGNDKLGFVLDGDKKRGARARANFEAKVPAYLKLKDDVSTTLKVNGFIRGIDGRPLYPRSEHAALNTLLQSAGAVVMKEACVLLHSKATYSTNPIPLRQLASVHDEYQFEVPPEFADRTGKIATWAITEAGNRYNFRCRLDGEFRTGANWAETH